MTNKLKEVLPSDLNKQREKDLEELDKQYYDKFDTADMHYNAQEQDLKDWQSTQENLQNENTEFTISNINREKEQAHKDYLDEQSAAFVDYKKEIAPHGENAEQLASLGLTNSGYGESARVAAYNAHQNRVAIARDSYNTIVANYNGLIEQAKMQNNAALAAIAEKTQEEQMKLALEELDYKNELFEEVTKAKESVNKSYLDLWEEIENEESGSGDSGGSGDSDEDKIYGLLSGDGDSGDGGVTVNEQSVADLGRGDITPEELLDLVNSGDVIEEERNGELHYKNAKWSPKRVNIFSPIIDAFFKNK